MTATRPLLVASDLDGTLLHSDGTVTAGTRSAIAAVEAAEVPFVVVTARAPRSLGLLAGVFRDGGIAVCANGALTCELGTGRVLHQRLLEPEVARPVAAALRAVLPELVFTVELPGRVDGTSDHNGDGSGNVFDHRPSGALGHEPGYVPSRPWPGSPRPLAELLAHGVLKLVGHHPHLGADALLRTARAVVGVAATVTASSTRAFVEIGPPGVDKASGLAALTATLAVPARHVVAFGDMPNDLPMLTWAGHGVAVANAHPSVLAAADEVAPGNDSDGVAQVLRRWFPG